MDPAEIETMETAGVARLRAAGTVDELRAAEAEVLGKRSALSGLHQRLGALDPDARKKAGAALHEARGRLQAVLAEARQALLFFA